MKTQLSIFLISFTIFFLGIKTQQGFGQHNSSKHKMSSKDTNDLTKVGLIGRVQSVTYYVLDLKTNIQRKTLHKVFNRAGNKIEEYDYRANGELKKRIIYQYDHQNRLILRHLYEGEAKQPTIKSSLEYDKEGNKIIETDRPKAKVIQYYDSRGNLFKKLKYNAAGKLIEKINNSWIYDKKGNLIESIVFYSNKHSNRSIYVYDDQGNKIEKRGFDIKGQLFNKIEWTYDSKGNMLQQDIYSKDKKLVSRLVQTYDSQGYWIRGDFYDKNGKKDSTIIDNYDDMGKPSSSKVGGLEFFNRHDTKGNCIENEIFKNGVLFKKKTAKIVYYDE